MVEELLAARGITVSHETVRQWARKFGEQFANQIRRQFPRIGENGISMRSCSKSPV
jgi:putative transposase